MKLILFFILTLLSAGSFSQDINLTKNYPLSISTVDYFAQDFAYSNDSIAPVGHKLSFRYLNIYTHKPAISQVFEEAYPFSRGYALIKLANKYGIINRNGDYVIQPKSDNFKLINGIGANPTVAFDDSIYFDFYDGKLVKEVFRRFWSLRRETYPFMNKAASTA